MSIPRDMEPIFHRIDAPIIAEPIPRLEKVAMPDSLKSHDIVLSTDHMPARDIVAEVNKRLAAEDLRLRRLLPPAPDGQRWVGEILRQDHFDWVAFSAETHYRLRYRLAPEGEPDDG